MPSYKYRMRYDDAADQGTRLRSIQVNNCLDRWLKHRDDIGNKSVRTPVLYWITCNCFMIRKEREFLNYYQQAPINHR